MFSHNLKWEVNFTAVTKQAHQWMYFLWQLKKIKFSQSIQIPFYASIPFTHRHTYSLRKLLCTWTKWRHVPPPH